MEFPFTLAVAVTPGNVLLAKKTRSLYIGTTGDVEVAFAYDLTGSEPTAIFKAVPAGTILPIRVTKVLAAPADTLALY